MCAVEWSIILFIMKSFVFFLKDGAIETPESHATDDFSILLSRLRLYCLP